MNDEITFLGLTTFRNQRKKFGIKTDDRRRHIYVVGKTGMGKTALLENMAIQDIQAGRGVGFIDPHGEAAEKNLTKKLFLILFFLRLKIRLVRLRLRFGLNMV